MSNELKVAINAAEQASQVLMSFYRKGATGEIKKKSRTDRVSSADFDSEKVIRKTLSENFPNLGLVGEEYGESNLGSEYKWYFDPLCGTLDFIHGYPEFGLSIALVKKDEILLGVCALPAFNEIFWAEKGKGSYVNGKKIQVSKIIDLSDSFATTDVSSNSEKRKRLLPLIENILTGVQSIKIPGSFPYSVCNLARGRSEAHVEFGVPPLHRLAAQIIALEAGGKITKVNGEKADIFEDDVFVSNGFVHEKILALIKKSV